AGWRITRSSWTATSIRRSAATNPIFNRTRFWASELGRPSSTARRSSSPTERDPLALTLVLVLVLVLFDHRQDQVTRRRRGVMDRHRADDGLGYQRLVLSGIGVGERVVVHRVHDRHPDPVALLEGIRDRPEPDLVLDHVVRVAGEQFLGRE